jgi:S-DNA-T family DNA segregation ATPase FtsK/SpoIIIE
MDTRRREKYLSILGFTLIAFSVLVALGLVLGPGSMNKVSTGLIDRLSRYLGYLVWIVPVMGVYWGWRAIRGGAYQSSIIFSVLVFAIYLTASTFSKHFMTPEAEASTNIGGALGMRLASAVETVFGGTGSLIVVSAGLVIAFILATGVSLRSGAIWLEEKLAALGGAIGGFVREAFSSPPSKPKPRVAKRQERSESRSESRAPQKSPASVVESKVSKSEASAMPPPPPPEPPRVFARQQDLGLVPDREPRVGMTSASASQYKYPPISIFEDSQCEETASEEELRDMASFLESKLTNFDINARVVEIHPGPVITRFEIEPGSSTKVHQVVNLADDLALALKARSIRILAPIPGKGTIGIEVPNKSPSVVTIKEILASEAFASSKSKLEIAVGKDVAGNPYVADLEAMPHLLIAGATGSGKSVCINSIITSLVYRNSPQDVQLLLIDPKRLELNMYEGIPHLVCEVVTEAKKAVRALSWVIEEMDLRYQLLAKRGVRNIQSYEEGLPYIVVVIDELADLMLTVPQELETAVTKLAQMARAVGIHLVMATQRPSVDVITGVIKANFPCRMGFKVASKTDSRTILDANGAERLLGKGDMLLLPPGRSEPVRVHGAFVSSEETQRLTEFLRQQSHLASPALSLEAVEHTEFVPVDKRDELFGDAARIVITHQQGSVSLLQRRLKVGYSRAARLIDFLEEAGIVGPFEGSKARQVLVDESYLENISSKL